MFVCTGNSARSQMAEALLRNLGGEECDVCSAGTNPKGLHPLTIQVMREIGIDVSDQKSKDLGQFAGETFAYVITVCDSARQQCPVFPAAHTLHWELSDPAAATGDSIAQLKAFREARDRIRVLVQRFLNTLRRSAVS